MGFRETYGGMLETLLNEAVDKHLDGEAIKTKLNEEINKLVDGELASFKAKVKANFIDQLNGLDDIKDV